jgi:hypothetical protein
MHYTHAQIIDLVQYMIGATLGEGCTVDEAERLVTEWKYVA